jgi:putative transposase
MDCISGVIPPTRGPWDDAGRLKTVVHHPAILPPYMRRSKSIETLLPALYLNCISTGDFSEALAALLDTETAGPSASTIGRLKVSVNHSPRLG